MERPRTRYAWNGDAAIAYQALGQGPDLVYLQGLIANVEINWENRRLASFVEELASWSRLIVVDGRGGGCSEREPPGSVSSLETLAADILSVLDAAG